MKIPSKIAVLSNKVSSFRFFISGHLLLFISSHFGGRAMSKPGRGQRSFYGRTAVFLPAVSSKSKQSMGITSPCFSFCKMPFFLCFYCIKKEKEVQVKLFPWILSQLHKAPFPPSISLFQTCLFTQSKPIFNPTGVAVSDRNVMLESDSFPQNNKYRKKDSP